MPDWSKLDPVVLFAGNLVSYQGIDLLLIAFQKVVAKKHNVRLQLVTDSVFSPYEELCRQLNIRQNIEILSSHFNDLPKHLARSDLVVNPRTDCSGIPQKLLNYMAAGKAIVSFAGSAKHLEHERTALIVKNKDKDKDTDAFATAIIRLLSDFEFATKLGNNAHQKSLQFSWQHNAIQTEGIYRKLI